MDKQKKPVYKKVWFWVLVVLIIAGVGNGMKPSVTTPVSDNSNSNDNAQNNEKPKAVTAKIGDKIKVGDLTFKVNSIKTSKVAGQDYLTQDAKDTYLIVNISITNEGNSATDISSSYFYLLNGEKSFESDASASIYDSGTSTLFSSLNPESTLTGNVYFDVSNKIAKSKDNRIEVKGGLFSSDKGEIKLVK